MAMVSNKFLGAVCVKLGFHKHLRYNGALVEYQIRDYVTELAEAERESDGARDYWTIVKNPPKVRNLKCSFIQTKLIWRLSAYLM